MNGLEHTDFGSELFNSKVFAVTFIFSFVEGLQSLLSPNYTFFWAEWVYNSGSEHSFHDAQFSVLRFDTVLLFVALYLMCGGKVLPQMASISISSSREFTGFLARRPIWCPAAGEPIYGSCFRRLVEHCYYVAFYSGKMIFGFVSFLDGIFHWEVATTGHSCRHFRFGHCWSISRDL